MADEICLITGATSGLGAAVARQVAARGTNVVVVGRSESRCEAVVERIRSESTSVRADYLVADLSVRAEVERLAEAFQRKYRRLDALINNAGGIFLRRRETTDGIEQTFALNYLAYFLLTHLLLDVLKASAPARVVNVASSGHVLVKGINFDDLQSRRFYRGFRAYHQSKLAIITFTYEMARRLQGSGVTINAIDPGMVATNIGHNNGWVWRIGKPVLDRLARTQYVSPEVAAETVVHVACAREVGDVTGRYFVNGRPAQSSAASHDQAAASRLFQVSCQLAGWPENDAARIGSGAALPA